MNKKFQVFVSSTYSDLKEERQAAVEAILTAGHIPAGMELFSAGDESQLEIIYRWIDESDIYMLLLGGRYGSIEPKSGISYTELEYKYAIERKKPCFALIMSDDYLDQKIQEERKGALELANPHKYEDFKKLVMSKISKFFGNKDRLQFAILQSILDIQSRHLLSGWVRSTEAVDATRVLNQISELNEKNSELEAEINKLRASMQKSPQEILKELSQEQRVLINRSSKSQTGTVSTTLGHQLFSIDIDKSTFPAEHVPKVAANWEHSFKELLKLGVFLETQTQINSRKIFKLSALGYNLADQLETPRS